MASRSSARGPLCTNLGVCCLLVSSLQIPVACWVNCQVVLFLTRVPPGPRIGHGSRADAVARVVCRPHRHGFMRPEVTVSSGQAPRMPQPQCTPQSQHRGSPVLVTCSIPQELPIIPYVPCVTAALPTWHSGFVCF